MTFLSYHDIIQSMRKILLGLSLMFILCPQSIALTKIIYSMPASKNILTFFSFDITTLTTKEIISTKPIFPKDISLIESDIYMAGITDDDDIKITNLSKYSSQSITVSKEEKERFKKAGRFPFSDVLFSPSGNLLIVKRNTFGFGGEVAFDVYKKDGNNYKSFDMAFWGYDRQHFTKGDSWLQIGELHTDYSTPTEVVANIIGKNGAFTSHKIGIDFFKQRHPLVFIEADISPDNTKLAVFWRIISKKSSQSTESHLTIFDIKRNAAIKDYNVSGSVKSASDKTRLIWSKYGIFLLTGGVIYSFRDSSFAPLIHLTKTLHIRGADRADLPPRKVPIIDDFEVVSADLLLLKTGGGFWPSQLQIWDSKQNKILWQSQSSDFLNYKIID